MPKQDVKEYKQEMECNKGGQYCIYVGIAANESIRKRLNWHVNQEHTQKIVEKRYLATLRQSLSSVLVEDQYDKKSTDDFIDRLDIEFFTIDSAIGSKEARTELHIKEKSLMEENLCILNITDNKHPQSDPISKELKRLRKKSR